MKKVLCIVIGLMFLMGCGGVKDLKFTKDNQKEVMEQVQKSKDLTGEENGLLIAGIMRIIMVNGPDGIVGKTVGEIINEQKKLLSERESMEKEQKLLAAEAKKKQEKIAEELRSYVKIAPFKKVFLPRDVRSGRYSDNICY